MCAEYVTGQINFSAASFELLSSINTASSGSYESFPGNL